MPGLDTRTGLTGQPDPSSKLREIARPFEASPVFRVRADEARNETLLGLAGHLDWDVIDQVAKSTRGVKTLRRLRGFLEQRSGD